MMKRTQQASTLVNLSASDAFLIHLVSSLGLASSFWTAYNIYATNLISDPVQTLRLICIIETTTAILLYSFFRQNPEECSYGKAVVQGVVGLPVGALLMAFGAIVLGAPVGIQYLEKSAYWSFLMSVFTFVPAACVYGSSWKDWQRVFIDTKASGSSSSIDYVICIPSHGAVIGAWLGAWPMPLDWERPWQEWPICVSYGALAGYITGMVVSIGFILFRTSQHVKND